MSSKANKYSLLTSFRLAVDRAQRFATTWGWMLNYGYVYSRGQFLAMIGFGCIARIGTLLGFIATIKSALWILDPSSIPMSFYDVPGFSEQFVMILLVLFPGLLFLIKAIAQKLHSKNSLALRSGVSHQLSLLFAKIKLSELSPSDYRDLKKTQLIASDMRVSHIKFFTLQVLLYNIVVLSFVFALSLFIALALDWRIVSFLMTLLCLLAVFFINYKHGKSFELTKALIQAKEDETESIRNFAHNLASQDDEECSGKQVILNLQEIGRNVENTQSYGQKFESSSLLFLDAGQALMIVTFLLVLVGQEVDSSHLTQLALLAVLFRFLINYMQAIVQLVLKLSPYYSFLQCEINEYKIKGVE